ncbi:carbohydrate ABC transporter permease [Lederbergia lenta]|uniref:Binding-protein-dependent transporters inner membrane component n=1 Tax=Lederbergia lenta TaxID=1467 RepID=A0A2X4ZNZ7_LEDLE|nr:carbohydrate ABC transporter permease [Lederbergia lenta]MCM3111819.1 carbohydrate ABC transporter permease [Lederbergia lenta]MEC2322973.1 carbohydrate ABC transporter permease [Lederbergia lenta]SQI62134.1 binding-protein-dependent transporters inner membrane component [Lederbergia lenta]
MEKVLLKQQHNPQLGLKKYSKKTIIYVILIIYALINAYPILWMILNSFKNSLEFAKSPFALPTEWLIANYKTAWETARLDTYFLNSIIVSVAAVIITVFIGALASYFLARFTYKWGKPLYAFFVFGLLIPIHATLVPMFLLMKNLNLLNTHIGLILPYIAFNLPITIFILVSFMRAFPQDIEESAIMDGCGVFRIFWSIILPMTMPAIATVVILNFINNWNEFSFALVLINDDALKTLPLGLANFAGQYTTNYGAQMAGLTLAIIPTIVIYMLLEEYLVKGMTAGAVKG